MTEAKPAVVVMVVYDDMVAQDLIGPLTIFAMMGAEIQLAGATLDPVRTDIAIPITPTIRLDEITDPVTVLCVPGGLKGTTTLMGDPAFLAALARVGRSADYVTSVCTGSLLLGAAGLLNGYRATSHWTVVDLLAPLGAEPDRSRVVVDRNRMTGGGVTAGIDFGLRLVALLKDEETAKRIQLVVEYAPEPPFASGRPDEADPVLVDDVVKRRAPAVQGARAAIERLSGAAAPSA